jgi:hypothetical protein
LGFQAAGKRADGVNSGFARRGGFRYGSIVSLTGIKDSIAALNVEERLEVVAWINHLNRADDPQHQAELDQRMSAMGAGRKSTQQELARLHDEMTARGQ